MSNQARTHPLFSHSSSQALLAALSSGQSVSCLHIPTPRTVLTSNKARYEFLFLYRNSNTALQSAFVEHVDLKLHGDMLRGGARPKLRAKMQRARALAT